MTNFDVSMTSYLNFVTVKPKIRPIFCSGENFSSAEIWFSGQVIYFLTLKLDTSTFWSGK